MPVHMDLRIEDPKWTGLGDVEAICTRALEAVATATMPGQEAKLDVLLSDDMELAALNAKWRNKTGPTDVLSFPTEPNPENYLGDIAIAYGVASRDASERPVSIAAHLSHLLIHGFLHLLGHDHIADDEAERMETIEREVLANLGIADPYSRIA